MVVDPNGHRTRVPLDPLPFQIGRQPENHLILRDSRASRTHARILGEDGGYVIEDCGSRHGTFVNGERISRHTAANSDRIEFGVPDSYQLLFALDGAELKHLMEQMGAAEKSRTAPHGVGGNLAKLRAILDLARTLQSSFSVDDVLTPVVDAALAITGAERGFLMLRKGEELETRVARNRHGRTLHESDLRVPRHVIHRALQHRRELLSMNFDPLATNDTAPDRSIADLELRSVICVPLVRIRAGQGDATSVLAAGQRNGGRALHGFADLRGGPGRRQPRTAADAGHRSLHHSRKRAPAGGRARQAADGRRAEPGAHASSRACCRASCPRTAGFAPAAAACPRTRWAAIISMCIRCTQTAGRRWWPTFRAKA